MSGSANAYTYTFGDPVNSSDPSGALTYGFSDWLKAQNNQEAQEVVAREVAREALEREEAERRAREAAAAAAVAGPQYAGGGKEEEYEEEGWEEYAAYRHNPQAEREASFGPGVGVAVVANGEGRIEDAVVRSPLESEEGGSKEVPPSERCGAESNADIASGGAHREYVRGPQCRKHKRSLYKNHYYARVRDSNGDWHKLFDTYCGIVGGAALTPGVDVFGAPAEVGCARVRRLQGSRNDH